MNFPFQKQRNAICRYFKKWSYYLHNWVNNSRPQALVDSRIDQRQFIVKDIDELYPLLEEKSSPTRKLSNLFWMTLPWGNVKDQLGDIRAFDTGCGSGNYGVRIYEDSGGITSYTGIDINTSDNWERLEETYDSFSFHQYDGVSVKEHIPKGTNFFMSQSAIEHFEDEENYYRQIRAFVDEQSYPIIQVHLVPAAAAIKLYKFHGYRQFTPRTLSRFTRLFDTLSSAHLFFVGGTASNEIHMQYITQPMGKKGTDYRDTKTREYNRETLTALKRDFAHPQDDPGFYALIMCHHWDVKIV